MRGEPSSLWQRDPEGTKVCPGQRWRPLEGLGESDESYAGHFGVPGGHLSRDVGVCTGGPSGCPQGHLRWLPVSLPHPQAPLPAPPAPPPPPFLLGFAGCDGGVRIAEEDRFPKSPTVPVQALRVPAYQRAERAWPPFAML